MRRRDRELGMGRPISRRDFLNGVAVTVGALGVGSAGQAPAPYPPALTGMRGSHDGSWEVAHALRDGGTFSGADTGETYDLVVVGGGVSGLAAAHFFKKRTGTEVRVLVLDNHDDFGGHAKRNELGAGGRRLIGYGGSQSIDTPSGFSREVRGLLDDLGVDLARFETAFDGELYRSLGLTRAVFFDRETFGADRLVPLSGSTEDFAKRSPLSPEARRDLVRILDEAHDYLPDLSPKRKLAALRGMSYGDFLKDHARLEPQVLAFLKNRTTGLFGIGVDAVPALNAFRLRYPGFQGLGVEPEDAGRMGQAPKPGQKDDRYIYHFPDGNASIPRLLVRALVPGVAPGDTMEDVVTAPFDYAALDRPGAHVRIRLESTAVDVRHDGPPERATAVRVTYVRRGKAETVRARQAVLACWNSVIPYICAELPEEQKQALAYAVKVPNCYINVALRSWTAFAELGVSAFSSPGGYLSGASLDFPVSLGSYRHPRSPEEPILVHLTRSPTQPGLPAREQFEAGRYELQATDFETFERHIREQLARALTGSSFDPARDIEAITVNRWPHGYAYEYQYAGEPEWTDGNRPCVVGRRPFGRIAIANSDAAGEAYLDAAVDQAYRAVGELIERSA